MARPTTPNRRQPPPAELAELLIVAAVQAWQRRDAAEWQGCHRMLTEGLVGADGLRVVDLAMIGCLQATAGIVHAGSRRDRYGRSSRQSFLTAYAHRIGERLRCATQETSRHASRQPGGQNLLPVLAARDDAVRSAMETMFPGMSTRAVAAGNAEGWASGLATADRASLGPSRALPGAG